MDTIIQKHIFTHHKTICRHYLPRDDKYNLKHEPQEVSLIGHINNYVKENSIIIDMGGGNGDLSFMLSKIYPNNKIILIDKILPHVYVNDASYIRITCDFNNTLSLDAELTKYINVTNEIIIVCKHLCGSGLDLAMDYFHKSKFKPTYFLLAMCCLNKIDLSLNHFNDLTKQDLDKCGWFTIKNKLNPKYLEGKKIVNSIFKKRINIYKKNGYDINVYQYVDDSITPYCYLFIGSIKTI